MESTDTTPIQQAQAIALHAWELPHSAERQQLIQKALLLDPHCVDALSLQACLGGNLKVAAENVKAIAIEAEAALGADFIEAHKGRLWDQEEARPYLRARLCLADLLARLGHFKSALPHLEALMRFAPDDALGVRYHIARCLACMGKHETLQALLARHEDIGPVWTWMTILHHLKTGKMAQAQVLLQHARTRNPHLEGFLTAQERPAKCTQTTLPLPGSKEEACAALKFLELPWHSDRQAMYWLMTEAGKTTR